MAKSVTTELQVSHTTKLYHAIVSLKVHVLIFDRQKKLKYNVYFLSHWPLILQNGTHYNLFLFLVKLSQVSVVIIRPLEILFFKIKLS